MPLPTRLGIEGKMFRPMAETFVFAILGAFLLSLTYVPMISSLFLSRKTIHKRNISDRIINKLNSWYSPLLNVALRFKKSLVGVCLVLLVITYFVFNSMGGEFIPTLEEGDFAVEVRLGQGTSLSQSIET